MNVQPDNNNNNTTGYCSEHLNCLAAVGRDPESIIIIIVN